VQPLFVQGKKKSHDLALLLLCKQSVLYLFGLVDLQYCCLFEGMVKFLNASIVIMQVGRINSTLPIHFFFFSGKYISTEDHIPSVFT